MSADTYICLPVYHGGCGLVWLVWFSLFTSGGFHLVRVLVFMYFAFVPIAQGKILLWTVIYYYFFIHAHRSACPYSHFQENGKRKSHILIYCCLCDLPGHFSMHIQKGVHPCFWKMITVPTVSSLIQQFLNTMTDKRTFLLLN